MIYTKTELVEIFRPIVEANDEIQEYVNEYGKHVPGALLHLLSNLDLAIRNAGLKAT